MKTSHWMRVVLFSLGLLLAFGLACVQAGPVRAQEGAAITLVKFEGVVTARPEGIAGTWTINKQDIAATEATIIVETDGEAVLGATVMVIAKKLPEGDPEAILIRVKPAEDAVVVYLAGGVTAYTAGEMLELNGDQEIVLTTETQIQGEIDLADHVLVKARLDGGTYEAITIQVVDAAMQRVVEFDGVVTEITDGLWVVAGYELTIGPRTMIMGNIRVGDRVQVRAAKTADGLLALLIRKAGAAWWPKQQEFTAIITSLPEAPYVGEWVIGERTVLVREGVPIVGTPEVGLKARVVAWHFPDGRWVALKIEVIEEQPPAEVTFTGEIMRFPMTLWGMWKIGERRVMVLPGTAIEGLPQVGAQATVTGALKKNDVIVAQEITVDGTEAPAEGRARFIGSVEEVSEGFVMVRAYGVNLWKVTITEETEVEGDLEVGRNVRVLGLVTGSYECQGLSLVVIGAPEDGKGQIQRTVN